jgi:hypothetical protein
MQANCLGLGAGSFPYIPAFPAHSQLAQAEARASERNLQHKRMEQNMTTVDKTFDAVHSIVPGLPSTFSLEVEDIIDRSKTDNPYNGGQSAIAFVMLVPVPLYMTLNRMFAHGWRPNAGRPDAYELQTDETWLGISLEGDLWMIEKNCPGRPGAVLAFGSGLVVTRERTAAAQLAELCNPEPPPASPLKWGPFWDDAPTSGSISANRAASFRRR